MKLNIKSASSGYSHHEFTPTTLASLDFGRLQPVMCCETLPRDDFQHFQGSGFMRMSSQPFPPFGKMFIKTGAFFVPEYQIYNDATAHHANMSSDRGFAVKKPWLLNYDINSWFVQNESSNTNGLNLCEKVQDDMEECDFDTPDIFPLPTKASGAIVRTVGAGLSWYRLTPKGRKVFAIFKALGYDFASFDAAREDGSTVESYSNHCSRNAVKLSAVPLLSYWKIYVDYFLSGVQYNSDTMVALLQSVRNKQSFTHLGLQYYDASTGQLRSAALQCMRHCGVPFETNMYTNAWNHVNAPIAGQNGSIAQYNNNTNSVISPYGQTDYGELQSTVISDTATYHTGFQYSALGHRTLMAIDNFVRRRNLTGTKAVQQIYALFGIKNDDSKANFAIKLSESSQMLTFNAVVSNADTAGLTTGKNLGDFGGYSQGEFSFNFNYRANDYGTIICLTWLNIDPMISRGYHPANMRVEPLDSYQPDFDGKAYRPIPNCEIAATETCAFDQTGKTIFGYTNMYDDYRCMRDNISGDFITDAGMRNAYFGRDFAPYAEGASSLFHPQTADLKYLNFMPSYDEFDEKSYGITQPFNISYTDGDRFWFGINWHISADRPILSSDDTLDLGIGGSTEIVKNGDMMS